MNPLAIELQPVLASQIHNFVPVTHCCYLCVEGGDSRITKTQIILRMPSQPYPFGQLNDLPFKLTSGANKGWSFNIDVSYFCFTHVVLGRSHIVGLSAQKAPVHLYIPVPRSHLAPCQDDLRLRKL